MSFSVARWLALSLLTVPAVPPLATHEVPLPGGPLVSMDYLGYDALTQRVWIPAGNTGRVDVLDVETGLLHALERFPTAEREGHGGRRVVGPSSVALGGGLAWVGNRANDSICTVDAQTLARGACLKLPAAPDGLLHVEATHEVWATVPALKELAILDATSDDPALKAILALDGKPEGYAVDEARGVYFTNLEDRDQAVGFDVRTRKQVSRWQTGCGLAGPRGMAFDVLDKVLLVACTDGAVAFDATTGEVRGRVITGAGVDGIAYAASTRTLFVASGTTAELQLFHVAPTGAMSLAAKAPTAAGARVVVADGRGRAYVADSAQGRVIVVTPP
jgi:DNA-binding beta-propeller fold protein YncE